MSSSTEEVLTVEGQAAYAQDADGQPQNVEPTAPTTGHAIQADVRSLGKLPVWCR